MVISEADKDLLNNDIVQKLAAPSRLEDTSWEIPGQVAWDWWNDYNLTHMDFKAGMNTPTFKYYRIPPPKAGKRSRCMATSCLKRIISSA